MASSPSTGGAGNNKADVYLTAEQAHAVLGDKLSSRFATVRKAFLLNKGTGKTDGYIDRKEFREALERINIKMTGEEFRRLWKTFDSSGDGKISYMEFNNQIGPLVSPPSMGLQMNRPETPKMKEWQRKAVARAMRKKVVDIEQTFKDIDTDGSNKISHAEFIQALRKMGIRGVGDTESWQMMTKFRRPQNQTGEMTFEEFNDCMLDYLRIPANEKLAAMEDTPPALRAAEAIIDRVLAGHGEVLMTQCKKFDPYDRGEIDYPQFRQALEASGVKLSKEEFAALCRKMDPSDDGGVYFRDLCLDLSGPEEHLTREEAAMSFKNLGEQDLIAITNPLTGLPYSHHELAKRVAPRLGISEIEARLIYSLLGRKETTMDSFTRFDTNKDGKLNPQEMYKVLDSLNVTVTDELISTLFAKYDKNHDGTVDFEEFDAQLGKYLVATDSNLSRLMLARVPAGSKKIGDIPTPSKAAAASSSSSATVGAGSGGARGGSSSVRGDDADSVATGALDLSPTAQKIRKVLGTKGYAAVLADAKKESAKRAQPGAVIGGDQLRDTLAKHGVPLTGKEVRALTLKYHGSGAASSGVDVEAMLKDTFMSSSTGGAASSPAKAKLGASMTSSLSASKPKISSLASPRK